MSPTRTDARLRERIYECLPAGRYALAGLLRLLDIVETTAIPTAAVECAAEPRLRINPDFVAEHAATPEKLMMLVLHEVHHVLLGHTSLRPEPTLAANFVFDCVINALLCRMFPEPAYTALFCDLYSDRRYPECLLRPPPRWNPRGGRRTVAPALRDPARRSARLVHERLYSAEGAAYEELYGALRQLLPDGADLADIALLGEHGPDGRAPQLSEALAQGIADIVRHWPAPPEPVRGQSLGRLLEHSRIRIAPASRLVPTLRRLVQAIADPVGRRTAGRPNTTAEAPLETPLPTADRRAIVMRHLGQTPLLYRNDSPRPAHRILERVHVYLDVSGSMDRLLAPLYGVLTEAAHLIHPRVHLFSTQIVDVPLDDLRRGLRPTTYGTDLRCVVEHLDRHRIRRALLLTDGHVAAPDRAEADVLRRTRLAIGWRGDPPNRAVLGPYAKLAADLA